VRLVVTLPNRIAVEAAVTRVGAEGIHGSFTMLPHHLDHVVLLAPGILSYTGEDGEQHYAAVDGGVLTKVGEEVRIATTAAVPGGRLEELKESVTEAFGHLDERDRSARLALARIETHIVQQLLSFEEPS